MEISTLTFLVCVMSTTEQMHSASGNSLKEEVNNININKGCPQPMGLHLVKMNHLLLKMYAIQHVQLELYLADGQSGGQFKN